MNNDHIRLITEGLKMFEASTKRAMAASRNPAFRPVYERELQLIADTRIEFQKLISQPVREEIKK